MSRGVFNWLFTIPKLALFAVQHAVFGGPNCTRLKVLKNSVRNCRPSLSSGPKFVVLNIAMSQLLIPWPRRAESTRDSSPKPQSGGAVKQFGLIQAIPPDDDKCGVLLLHAATTS